jgi:hypothetical protein
MRKRKRRKYKRSTKMMILLHRPSPETHNA